MAQATPAAGSGEPVAAPGAGPRPRVAIFVDYENVYYADTRQFGPDGVRSLAEDLASVARECGPVTVARAIAPFDRLPAAARSFQEAGFEPVFSGGRYKNEADLHVIKELMSLDERAGVGVVFLVSGDGHMHGAIQEAQEDGRLAVVVACQGSLSRKLKLAADLALHISDLQGEAARLKRGQPPSLGLADLAAGWSGPAGDATQVAEPAAAFPAVPESSGPARASDPPDGTTPTRADRPEAAMFTSPSALKLYVQCPQRYRLVHLERRKEPPTAHLFVGNVVHQALREFFDRPPGDRQWAVLEQALRRAWAAAPERSQVFPRPAEEAKAGTEALADLRRFFERTDTRARPFALEVFLMTEVGEGVIVRGKVDRVDPSPRGGGLVIIDYKTGRAPARKPTLIDEFQLPLYQAMVSEAWSEPVEKVVLHYLKGNVFHEYSLEEKDVSLARNRAYDIARQARSDTRFAPRVGPLCRFCGLIEACPEQAAVRQRYLEPAPEPAGPEASLPF